MGRPKQADLLCREFEFETGKCIQWANATGTELQKQDREKKGGKGNDQAHIVFILRGRIRSFIVITDAVTSVLAISVFWAVKWVFALAVLSGNANFLSNQF